jgi:creatinine amidohydrolase
MRFGDLTFEEIRDYADSGALAVVPTGCTEQQGPHLPVDWDTWFAEEACLAAAARLKQEEDLDLLVVPAMPFGPTPEHRDFGSGYIDIPQQLHQALLDSVLRSLADQGFGKLIVWRGCGGHDLRSTVEAFNGAHPGRAQAYLPAHPYHDIWLEHGDPRDSGGHADSFATSIALFRRPSCVRTDRIVDAASKPVDWDDPNLNFAKYSSTGVIGNAAYAKRSLGETLWHETIRAVADSFAEISRT